VSIELDNTAADPEASTKPDALAAGTQLGKYKLERLLGEGGMGQVWSARDPDLQRSVAIKVLKFAKASVTLRQRLLREAVAMAKLKHPNVLTVYEVGTVGDRDFIAMELVEGLTLDDWLSHRPPIEEVWSAILAAGRGLAAAHDAGVVHRDFKPHNVLRSKDGRVLVSDFGLARGVINEEESAAADAIDLSDSVLDAPLTHTGALIGTPAYMAPEQYRGEPPDARTDQFAFCVTAWQAFTGERPFKGSTLDEMKKAVGGGVSHLTLAPERAVRAILSRGLDPKPDARWPSLEVLLEELIKAERIPRRRRLLYAASAALVMIAAAIAFVAMRRGTSVANACDAPEKAFAVAWSPTTRSAVQRASAGSPGFDKVASTIDLVQDRWVASYQKACRSRNARVFPERIRCLEGLRDQASGVIAMLSQAPPPVFDRFDPAIFAPLTQCERANPQAPPLFPTDEPRRSKVLAMYGKLMSLVTVPPAQIAQSAAALEAEAAATGWQPVVAIVQVMIADTYLRAGMLAEARATYLRALPATKQSKDHRLEARVHFGALDVAMKMLANPTAPVPPRIDDEKTLPVLHPELVAAFATARSAINDDPLLLGSLELSAAEAYLHLAQWQRYPTAYTEALTHAQEARRHFESVADVRRAAMASAREAEIYLSRGDDRALDSALFAALKADDALTAAKLPTLPELDNIRRRVAFARREFNELHRLTDTTTAHETTPGTIEIKGRVEPPQRVRIIAWSGNLVGDPRRGYIDTGVPGIDIVQSAEDGSFTVHAEPGWAIFADGVDQRSVPQAIGTTPLVLAVKPAMTLSGTVKGRNMLGVRAFAEYKVGASSWTLIVPVERDGTFDLRGMPAGGTPSFGTSGDAGHGERTVRASSATALTWPFGQAVEVIVRGLVGPVTIMSGANDVATAEPIPVGASNTDAGREYYQPGDFHAVITGVATGPMKVCAGEKCRQLAVEPSVMIEYPDGRFGAGVTPTLLGP